MSQSSHHFVDQLTQLYQNSEIISQPSSLAHSTSNLRFSILASGSSGNCTYIETDQNRVIVDAGLSGKKIEALFQAINRDIRQVDAIFVTHEHKDHVHGVGVLSRRYNLPIYANHATWLAMEPMLGPIAKENKRYIEPGTLLEFGDIDILSYQVSHDAADPQFYAFQKGKKQFVMLTDTGYLPDRLRSQLKNADAYLIESNHEIEMLRYGPYPWSVKQRILSDKGHLSNEDGALAIRDLMGPKSKHVYLGHLSRDNNTKQLAIDTVTRILNQYDIDSQSDLQLHMTDPSNATILRDL